MQHQQSANLTISKWLNTDKLIYWCITKISAPLCKIYSFIDIQTYLKILSVKCLPAARAHSCHCFLSVRLESASVAGSFAVQITNGRLAGFQRGKRLISLNLFPSNPTLNSSEGQTHWLCCSLESASVF